jgi:hypothetical protein
MNSTINDHGNRINSNSSQINYVQNLTTATSNTVNNLVGNFENISNKSSDIQADATSTTKYPTVKSIKDYVDGTVSSGVADANSVTKGKLKLAGDLGGTADLPSVPGLAAKAPINNPSFTGTVSGISKTMVGLSNVDNTSDASKPVSTAVQTALDGKQSLANLSTNIVTDAASLTKYPAVKTIKDYVDAASSTGTADATTTSKGKIKLAGDLAGTADLPTVPDLALKAPINNPTFSGTVGGITKSMVGLSNVDNTSDASKPVSLAVQAALDGKQTLANLSTNMTTDAASLTKYPAVKTIKDYVDATVVSAGSAVPYSGAIQNVNLGNYGLSAATVNSIYVGKGIGSGIENTIVGMNAGNSATTDGVTLLGYRAGYSLNQGRSTMVGDYAGYYLYGGYNVVEGSSAARYQSASTYNTVMGYTAFQGIAGFVNTNYSNYNTAVGAMSMLYHRNGNNNVALGYFSLAGDASTGSSGDANTAIGSGALRLNGAGYNNVALGAYAGYYETGSNTFYVNAYDRSSVIGDQQQSLLYGKFDMTAALQTLRINAAVTIPNTLTVSNTVSGASFVTTSDLRLKTNIQPLGAAMATINQLQPVSYDKKFDLQSSQFSKHEWGFIAQELQKVLPHAVVEGKDEDKILSVDYITLIPLLTKALQEQGQQLKAADERYRALEEKVERLMKLLSK